MRAWPRCSRRARPPGTKRSPAPLPVAGVTPSYFTVQDIAVQSGRLIVSSDLDSATSVAVLGTEAAYQLFGTWDAVGGTVTLGDRNYKVVGVLGGAGLQPGRL